MFSNTSHQLVTFLALLTFAHQGCGKARLDEIIEVRDVNHTETKLLSELSKVKGHLIKCPIPIRNLSDQPQTIKLISTGCSCYGVEFRGKKIERGDLITVPATKTIQLHINAQAPLNESLQSYRAKFELPTADQPEIRQLHCELQVYQDLKIFPRVLICDTEQGESTVVEKAITLERIFRSEDGSCITPEMKNLPNGVSVENIVQLQDAVKLEVGIWKAIWQANLRVSVPGDLSATGKTSNYAVVCPTSDSGQAISGTAKIIQRVRVPVHYPQEIHFGRIPVDQPRNRSLFLSSVDGGKFALRVNKDELPKGLDVAVPDKLSDKYKIDLNLQIAEAGEWNHQLILQTDLENQPKIMISLNAIILNSESN